MSTLLVGGLAVLVLIVVAVVNQRRAGQMHPPAPTLLPRSGTDPARSTLPLPGHPIDIAASGSRLYVLTADPGRIVLLDHSHPNRVLQSAPVDTGVHAQLVIDIDTARVWVLRTGADRTSSLVEFDALSLARLRVSALGPGVSGAVPLDDQLWLATGAGLARAPMDGPGLSTLTAVRGAVTALAVSRPDYSLLVAVADGERTVLDRVDVDTLAVTTTSTLPVHGAGLALVGSSVWASGVRQDGRGTVLRLSPATLRPEPSAVGVASGERAVTVWPGIENLWVLDGGVLSCLQPATGALLASTPRVSGPVLSNSGYVYAVSAGALTVLDLSATRCSVG